MKTLFNTLLLLSISLMACSAPIKHSKTVTYKVYGNCGTCQKTIETAANKKGEAKARWDKSTKMVSLTFDSTKTNADEVLKRIAYAGYDNEKFFAPADAYSKLPGCCQYERPKKETATASNEKANTSTEKAVYACPMHPEVQSDKPGKCPKCGMALVKKDTKEATSTSNEKAIYACPMHPEVQNDKPGSCPKCGMALVKKETKQATTESTNSTTSQSTQVANPLADVYTAYFGLKDALTKDDGSSAATKAKELFQAITNVKMEKLQPSQHEVWMNYMQKLSYDTEHIKATTEIGHQREHFAKLSANMHELMKVVKPDYAVYYDHCPMFNDGKGADWLSKESPIKNPYFGSQMISCGKTVETIK